MTFPEDCWSLQVPREMGIPTDGSRGPQLLRSHTPEVLALGTAPGDLLAWPLGKGCWGLGTTGLFARWLVSEEQLSPVLEGLG